MARTLTALALTAGCAVALGACGGSGSTSSGARASSNSALAAAQCMRDHDVPNFPDPDAHGTFSIVLQPGGAVQVNGTRFAGPTFTSAERACQFYSLTPPGPITESQRRAELDFAACMRRHGFPRWADPAFPVTGGIYGGNNPYPQNTPGVLEAARTCNRIVQRETG